jgi:hypothetical protein
MSETGDRIQRIRWAREGMNYALSTLRNLDERDQIAPGVRAAMDRERRWLDERDEQLVGRASNAQR